jgi:hypothetical protein
MVMPDPQHVWCWSRWRPRRQYQARACHYRRRGYAPLLAATGFTGKDLRVLTAGLLGSTYAPGK